MRRATQIILILLAVFLIIQAAYSLRWTPTHDAAPLLYETFLMQGGKMPYRDIFDFQMPGAYAAYYLLGLVSNFGPLRLRILDLLILAALLVITYIAMRRFGKLPALAGGILFGLAYLQGGPSLSLQREYILLIFIAPALLIGIRRDSLTPKHRLALGLLFGLAAVIKPHAALGLLPFLLFDIADLRQRPNISLPSLAKQSLLPMGLGFLIPIALTAIWLGIAGALIPFLDIASNYWGLYSQINGRMEINTGADRWLFILAQLPYFGGYWLWLIPAGFGVYLHRNRQTGLLASLALCYAIYPALSGQFFPYHYIPFAYLILLLASISISAINHPPLTIHPSTIHRLSSFLLILIIILTIRPSTAFIRQIEGKSVSTSTNRAGEIARFLERNIEPGDTVQPLDWTGGTLLAMLQTRAPLATSYVFDFYFYHHVSDPYIQSLRADFMTQLQESNPRFIVEVTAIDKPWVSGEDTNRNFPELRIFLDERYSVTIERNDYIIYELDGGR
ncbi:MAG TPA: hypothetical protein PLF42_01615 [Anaerolineales bacterium]|nr:hypothetical protein [Anaerolineales bacterium]